MAKKKTTWGGRRPNSGRPKEPDAKAQVTGRVPQWVARWLVEMVETGEAKSVSALVGELVQESAQQRRSK